MLCMKLTTVVQWVGGVGVTGFRIHLLHFCLKCRPKDSREKSALISNAISGLDLCFGMSAENIYYVGGGLIDGYFYVMFVDIN